MKRFFKVIELLLNEEEQAYLDSVSIVEKPAIDRNFIAFSEDKPTRLNFDDERMVVLGPAMVPNQRIPRTDENGDLYFVYFSPETIRLAADLFLKKNKASKSNVNHRPVYSDKLHVMESWIKESDNDKSVDYGFGDLPVGTWFVSMKVDDMDTWKKIKSGDLNGFSVEGAFMFGPEALESLSFARYKTKYKDIRRRYRKAYKGLSEEEKQRMDSLIYMLEEIGNDKYDDPAQAVARSRELGLEGRIHSHTDNGLTYYMPGSTHEEYESALLMMEIDVQDLPDYVDPGATGDIQSEFVSVSPGESKDEYIGRCMSALQGEYPNEDQRYAVCITEWESGFSKENFESYTDYPEDASNNAQRALDWKEKNGSDCGTPIGWTRARQLANREPISEETIARMASFERHRQNSETPYSEGCGGIMWDAWGGSSGIRWAQTKLAEIRGENLQEEKFLSLSEKLIVQKWLSEVRRQYGLQIFAERPISRIPKEERGRTGSEKNEPGDSKTTRGGVEVSQEVEKTLKEKIAEHNEKNPQDSQKANLGMLKAVWRRGAGAYSVGTPGRRGMTRNQWAMGRVNAFLKILSGSNPSDKDYTQDNDLLPKSHPRHSES